MERKSLIFGIISGFFLLLVAIGFDLRKSADGNLHIIFCDVGQGDAILIKTPSGADILNDGGPNDKVLDCLSRNLPFWDRTLDMVIVSHPQADHISGIISVLKRYKIDNLLVGQGKNIGPEYEEFKKLVLSKNIPVNNPYLGEKIDFGDGVSALVLWPEKSWMVNHLSKQETNKNVLGAATFNGDLNESSTVILFQYKNFKTLLTGDADADIQPNIAKENNLSTITLLKVPHHGSKKALDQRFLQIISPALAVISVGKNSFGHPAKELLVELNRFNIKVKRTDKDKQIEVVSDGKNWYVK